MSLRYRLQLQQEPLYLMDGSAFVYRGFYAFQNMARADGFPTNVLFLVTRLLLRMMREERPQHYAFILDGKGKNFRHDLFPDYKAKRLSTPEPLIQQLQPLQEIIQLLGFPVVVSEGCEADDCIASLTARFSVQQPIVIVGADKDLRQCLNPMVTLWDPVSKNEKITTDASFREETGFAPTAWPDYQAIIGDSSDNIPGVAGIGPKTADTLFSQFTSLEAIRDNMAAVPPAIRKKLEGNMDAAFLYRELTRLKTDTCATLDLPQLSLQPCRFDAVMEFLKAYELRALMREFESMLRAGTVSVEGGAAARPLSMPRPAPVAQITAPSPVEEAVLTAPKNKTSAAKAVQAVGQGSLLDIPSAMDANLALLPRVATVDALSLVEGSCALISCDNAGLLLAQGDKESIYTGEHAGFFSWLAAAMHGMPQLTIVSSDMKGLLALATAEAVSLPIAQCFDIGLAAYLMNPEDRSYSLEHLVRRWGEQAFATFTEHPTTPGLQALALAAFFTEHLAATQMMELLLSLELPLIPVLLAMEQQGIRIDKAAFAAFLAFVQGKLELLTTQIYTHAGGAFNIRSSQQLGEILFAKLGLPKAGKTRGGQASTAQEALEKLTAKLAMQGAVHPIIPAILEFRTLEKLRSTYLEPMPKLADARDRIHTTFNQMATATGRLSSSNPNLQNIPIRGEFGPRMRACFIAQEGYSLVAADYSQIELRVLAHLSQDPTLLEAFRLGQDIHSRTAALLYEVAADAVTPDQRRNAKTINFGLIYGMGPQKLAQDLGITMNEAKQFISVYFARLEKLKLFYDSIEKEAQEQGYVVSMAGRRRLTPEIASANAQLRSQARRQAINARIQGSAADIIKLAMLAVHADAELAKLDARLILQVHDELLLEVPSSLAEQAAQRMAQLMEEAIPHGHVLSVPLVVDWGIGQSWDAAH